MMKPTRICNVPKCTTKGHDRKGWLFPMVGGPYHNKKYRIFEPLPWEWKVPLPDGGRAIYVMVEMPEKKRWPVMYVYDEVRSDDCDRDSDGRRRRLERLGRALLVDPSEWCTSPVRDGNDLRRVAKTARPIR